MSVSTLLLYLIGGLLPLGAMAYFIGKRKAVQLKDEGARLHSGIGHYGWFATIWLALPAIGCTLLAGLLHITGVLTVQPQAVLVIAFLLAAGGLWLGMHKIQPALGARIAVERVIIGFLLAASLISILTTLGIVVSILFEALRFFDQVSIIEFLTGTEWNPGDSFLEGAGRGAEATRESTFGSVPIFAGTFMITAIAMLVAVPIGLFSAIYMTEYAPFAVRNASKPILEILAGIPTVVYGFFAAITVSPLIVDIAAFLGLEADYVNALSPGIVMGIMIIPLISSLSDDVLNAVPQNLREGSLALGMTRSETVKKVILPAALPGIVSAFLLGISRALGETMIVVMAAGLRPNLTWNPLEGMTTVTVRIVNALTGDKAFDSPETLSAFALGLVLFVVTLTLNVIATLVIRKFRKRYET